MSAQSSANYTQNARCRQSKSAHLSGLNRLLQISFALLLCCSIYLALDIIAGFNLNSTNNSQQQTVRDLALADTQPLQLRLNQIKIEFKQLLKQLNNASDLKLEQIKQRLQQVQNHHPIIRDFGFITDINDSSTFYSSQGGSRQSICPTTGAIGSWQSRVISDADPAAARLIYQLNLGQNAKVSCLRLRLSLTDFVETFHDKALSPSYQIVLDNHNRIAYHPRAFFINRLANNLLILDPVMALVAQTGNVRGENHWWPMKHHVAPMDNGQWQIATLWQDTHDHSRNLEYTRYKQLKLQQLQTRLAHLRSILPKYLKAANNDPNKLLLQLENLMPTQPKVLNFHFAGLFERIGQQHSCVFDTSRALHINSATVRHCTPFSGNDGAHIGRWTSTIDFKRNQLKVEYRYDNSNPVWQAIGFSMDLEALRAWFDDNPALDQLFVIANQADDTGRSVNLEKLINLSSGHINTKNDHSVSPPGNVFEQSITTKYLHKQRTGQSLWIQNNPMDEGNWRIVTIAQIGDSHLSSNNNDTGQNQIWLLFIASIFATLISYAMMLLRIGHGESREYWHLVIFSSGISIIAIGLIWAIALYTPFSSAAKTYPLADETGLAHARAVTRHQYHHEKDKTAKSLVLGLRVDSITLSSSAKLKVIGLLWIKNLPGVDPDQRIDLNEVTLDFPNAEKVEFEPHVIDANSITRRFTMELDFPLSSAKYPFERGLIAIRITTANYRNPYLLMPDLPAYGMTNPLTKPGLAEGLELSGWSIFSSYFSYQPWLNTTKFHEGDALYDGELNALYFNVEIGRNFLNPFIADMVPIIVITALLFLVLMTMTKDEQHMNELGFDASTMLGYCSGLFFVLIVAHVYLREKLNIDTIAYIEYFYFTMYFVILSLSACAILFSDRFQQHIMTHEDGVVIKLLFLPVIFTIVLAFTFLSFY